MSQRLQKQPANEGSTKPVDRKAQNPRRDGPSRAAQAGNAAIANLLAEKAEGRALPSELRARLEHGFGIDLGDVRIRDDGDAQRAAQSLDAEAFVQDGQIHMGPGTPSLDSPAAAPLIAHEVAHIAQQRAASVVEARVSAPGEASEQQADQGAQQVLSGGRAQAGNASAVPAVARQQKNKEGATRAEAEQALLEFLQKVASMQPAPDLRRSGVVRNALNTLASDPSIFIDVNRFLGEVPNDPAQIAQRFAQQLPALIDRQRLEKLKKLTAADTPEGGVVSRAVDKFKKAAPGGPDSADDSQQPNSADQKDKPKDAPRGADPVNDPQYVKPSDQGDKEAAIMRRWAGVGEPTTIGPVNLDLGQAYRFLGGLGKAVHPPTPHPAPPVAKNYPDVEAAIAKIPEDALVPAEARGKGLEGNFASARDFARDLAHQMDVAQQSGKDTIQVNLGDDYAQVKDRASLRAAVEGIIAQLRAALPHHATNVINVDVMTGKTPLTRGRARSSE